ncbi:peptidoglycan-associated lipoprotein Pal [Psychrobacter sp. YP14]|uniref:Peptidoglycan-associated lipoprotein n=1 Tax=Psychrobacter raelei TaxID=2565531 RepID=A0AAT9PG16_9GAMM|nr:MULTISPECIES: peptidoglycan-associated lipoprotein Pal [unclassified Psychrobacter]AWT48891.1 peptidoglycan-associated lipoprotein Pal [Psychrobacter sp. YP14]UNK06188.1 peptidoglycan-associated lipoprotein Pal [Psychrobacter sp. PraFG1]
MYSTLKISAISLVSAALLVTTGCASKSNTSEFVVAPMAVPGNAAYQTGPLVTNSEQVQADAQNLRSVVRFAFDSYDIDAEAANILDEQVAFLSSHPDARVLVAGHTDERGSSEYNHALGERRAQAVRSYLASKGIMDARVETISYGEDRPVAAGSDEASYSQNRRAELSY